MSGQADNKDQIDQVELADIARSGTNVEKEEVIRHVLKSEQDRLTAGQTVWRFKKVSRRSRSSWLSGAKDHRLSSCAP